MKLGPSSSYRFFAQQGRAKQRLIAKLGVSRPAYVHSFAMSERHLVLAEFPFVVRPLELALSGRPYIENYRWQPERGGKLHVVSRDTGELERTYEAEPGFCFHHVNAFERGRELVCDLLRFEDPSIVGLLYLDRLRLGHDAVPAPQLRRYRMDLGSGRISEECLVEQRFELPRIDYSRNGCAYRYVWGNAPGAGGAWFDSIVKVDLRSRSADRWSEKDSFPGEPIFVPAPEREAEDEGVLLSVVLDAERASSYLLVLDAASLEERARARVPHHIPFGFHGQYTSRV